MAPLIRALAGRPWCEQGLIFTGQHAGLEAVYDFLPAQAVKCLDVDPREQSAGEIRETIYDELCGELAGRRPDFVLVQGDTSSALAGALAARDCRIPLGHVEAGLRSHNLDEPWPEEGHRIAIDAIADLLFAPSGFAAAHLAEEGVAGAVHITGNTGIDALFEARRPLRAVREPGARKTLLVTCHRRENRGAPLAALAGALKRIARELPVDIVFPLHPSPYVREATEALLSGHPGITLIEPVGHDRMVALLEDAWLVLTDSGGLQEEGPSLGKAVLVLRNVTERPEAGENLELVGTDPERIFAAVEALLTDPEKYARMSRPTTAFGDGRAAERIADIIERWFEALPVAAARIS